MTNNGVEQKPSETALFAALRRAIAYKEHQNDKFGPDYLAESFLPAHFKFFLRFRMLRTNVMNKLDTALPGLNEYMIARTAYFDSHFANALKNNTPQIVLMGAGYDTRAFRFAKLNQGTKIFELDAAPTQNKKKECLKKAGLSIPQELNFVPINFNEELLGTVLEAAGYSNSEKTLFIWEGVSYYLDPQSVAATLASFNHSSHPESVITFDYIISVPEEKMTDYYGVQEFSQTMAEHHANEGLVFSIEEDEIGAYLERNQLKIVEHLDNEEIESNYLTDENGLLLGHMTGHFHFVTASKK